MAFALSQVRQSALEPQKHSGGKTAGKVEFGIRFKDPDERRAQTGLPISYTQTANQELL
jgi:hypothetical protein